MNTNRIVNLSLLSIYCLMFAYDANGQVLTLGRNHTVAVNSLGTATGWGDNTDGQASGGNSAAGLTAVSAATYTTLGLRANGTVTGWGWNGYNLISGASGLTGITAIDTRWDHALALKSNGTVVGWGDNSQNQASGGSSVTGATAVSAGGAYSLALKSNGTVAAWGYNASGQVSGAAGVSGAVAIAAGYAHGLALKSNGTVAAWGANNSGQIGTIGSLTNVAAVAADWSHSLALRNNGTVAAFGTDFYGETSGAATQTNLVWVGTGEHYSYGVKSDGSLVSWGKNVDGQRNTPASLALPTGATWATATSGDYLNAHRWSQQLPSTALSDAIFDKSGSYSVAFGNQARAKSLNVTAGSVNFQQNGHTYKAENSINVGSGATLFAQGPLQAPAINVAGYLSLDSAATFTGNPNLSVINSNSLVSFASGDHSVGSLTGSGRVNLNSANLTVGANNNSLIFGGEISGSGNLIKTGIGTTTFSGANTYTGLTQIDSGTISLSGNERIADTSHVVVGGAGAFTLNGSQETIGNLSGQGTVNLNSNATLRTGGNNTGTTFTGNIAGNGTLRKQGVGTMTLVNPQSLTGNVRVDQGTLRMAGNNLLTNLSTSGLGLAIGPGGTLDLNTTSQTIGLVGNDGTVNLSGGSLNASNYYSNLGTTHVGSGQLSGQILANFAGGTFNVGTGGALQSNTIDNQSGAIINLDPGAFLMSANIVNNGTIFGDFQINLGQTLSGAGTAFAEVTVFNGGILAPGNSIDTITFEDLRFGPGGKLELEIADADGAPGSGWDAVNVNDTLQINATSANPIELHLLSFDAGIPQPIGNFDNTQSYSWTFLSAAGGITGFDSSGFTVNTDDFAFYNPFSGTFRVERNGNDLNLVYAATIPEPGSLLALAAAGSIVGVFRRRRLVRSNT